MAIEVPGNNEACVPVIVLRGRCDGVLYGCKDRDCRVVVTRVKGRWRDIDRKDQDLEVGCPDFDGYDVWVVAGDLAVGGGGYSSIDVGEASEANCIGLRGSSVLSPGAVGDMCAVSGGRGLLDQENIQQTLGFPTIG